MCTNQVLTNRKLISCALAANDVASASRYFYESSDACKYNPLTRYLTHSVALLDGNDELGISYIPFEPPTLVTANANKTSGGMRRGALHLWAGRYHLLASLRFGGPAVRQSAAGGSSIAATCSANRSAAFGGIADSYSFTVNILLLVLTIVDGHVCRCTARLLVAETAPETSEASKREQRQIIDQLCGIFESGM